MPYGTWPSPVTAEMITAEGVKLGQARSDGETLYWVEVRPAERGRGVLMRWRFGGLTEEISPRTHSVRTRAQEYGGGDFVIVGDAVVFSRDEDQRLYRLEAGAVPMPLTPEGPWRYADGVWDAGRGRVICVMEDHGAAGEEPVTRLVGVDAVSGGVPEPLAAGHDFYASPCLSPDGGRFAWLTWDHPDMPWNGSVLWVADVDEAGALSTPRRVGGGRDESIFQPSWSPDGELYFVSDRTGWWNLYRERGVVVEGVLTGAFETGLPQWVFGMSTYAFLGASAAVVAVNELGVWRLVRVDTESGAVSRLTLPYTDCAQVLGLGDAVAVCAGSPREAPALVWHRPADGRTRVVRRSSTLSPDADCVSHPQHIAFPTTDQAVAHGLYYPPTHPACVGPGDEKPPLIVKCHGGPTACASTALDPRIQFWTSRGFAVLDVNYRGSTGFGRLYRHALDGAWGRSDVADCEAGARFLADLGRADENRLIIAGGSAGGYTALAALAFTDTFRAGASYYGISDLEALARDTHKFEARYLDRLVGPYPAERETYRARSPLHFAGRIRCPVIFFQGLRDHVVPPNQAEGMVDALGARGVPVAYVTFEEEGHGFRQAESSRRAIESELSFYARVFHLDLPDAPEPVAIRNLPEEEDREEDEDLFPAADDAADEDDPDNPADDFTEPDWPGA
jgi:dipeptidyl aminopeptidase/acylaminoacyl peptidase